MHFRGEEGGGEGGRRCKYDTKELKELKEINYIFIFSLPQDQRAAYVYNTVSDIQTGGLVQIL